MSREDLDLLVLNREKDIVVRFRDNGSRFDPIAFLKGREAGYDHLGIQIACHMADELNYRYNIGLNNLQIVINKRESI